MPGNIDEPDEAPDEHVDPEGRGERGASDQERTDAAWARIVAELSDLSTDPPVERTPAAAEEGVSFDFPVAPWVHPPLPSVVTPRNRAAGPRDWPRSAEVEAAEERDGEFVAPDPGIALSSDPLRNVALLALGASPVALVLSWLFWENAPRGFFLSLAAVFLGGAALAVWRLPRHRDTLPGDDGARV
ncbi:hypothetical protein [Sanguibacter antarcticus]|uniref:Uncharacterized protein n=1 Tax=Sanguibacter antarcticus TaxID=372484 RepID=A0A2A9E2W1_9MICO|nr:hypothetical protein [Sanguibacter antarcticus]PFG32921.1 hypothetical protein ATL42_0773 [Sanguibacter antarcticus]